MKKIHLFLLASATMILVISCKKDSSSGSTTPNAVTGNWTFVSLQATTQSTDQYTDAGTLYKTVTLSNYTSSNNSGTVTFTADSIFSKGITYAINTVANAYDYEDGMLVDSFSSPINETIPVSSGSASYKLIGTDSLHFVGNSVLGSVGTSTPSESGSRFAITGNLMKLTSIVAKDTVVNVGGFSVTQIETATVVTTLQKQ